MKQNETFSLICNKNRGWQCYYHQPLMLLSSTADPIIINSWCYYQQPLMLLSSIIDAIIINRWCDYHQSLMLISSIADAISSNWCYYYQRLNDQLIKPFIDETNNSLDFTENCKNCQKWILMERWNKKRNQLMKSLSVYI